MKPIYFAWIWLAIAIFSMFAGLGAAETFGALIIANIWCAAHGLERR